MIDTHAHLYSDQLLPDIEGVIQRARSSGVERILLPNIDASTIETMMQLASTYPDEMVPMIGLHPTSVSQSFKEELEVMQGWLGKADFCAIGEIGIDLYWDKTFLVEQTEAFETQLQWAIDAQLPIVIHARDSFPEIICSLEKFKSSQLTGVFHSFTGGIDEVEKIEKLGDFMFGINGIVTFKNSTLSEVIPSIGLDRLLLETDAPYLAPTPYRGKRNESAYLGLIKNKIADILDLSPEEVDKRTTQNAIKKFRLK